MSAAVICGCKRSFLQDSPSSPSKKLRSTSHFSPTTPMASHVNPFASPPLHHLHSASGIQVLEETLQGCGNDLDVVIKRLMELHLGSSEWDCKKECSCGAEAEAEAEQPIQKGVTDNLEGVVPGEGNVAPLNTSLSQDNLPEDGSEWVELFVREMSDASDIDDAKVRASRILAFLQTVIHSRACAEAEQNFQMEKSILKEQIDALARVNTILKRAVAIQHERQKKYDEQRKELQQLKQVVSQFREQMKTLEVNNYALAVHLKLAQSCTASIPGRFPPDVF